ncbi:MULTISPECIES: serine/threonine-protein kinase [unclassified Blastococcus]
MGGPVRRVLGGRYELVELLATGGMGRVWRARDLRLGRAVAVKVLRGEYTDDAVSLARFRAEAQVSARLVHRNIAALHDYGEADGPDGAVCAYLVMELVEGESLAARLAREPRPPLDLVLDVVDQTAAALAAAHAAGVVHRDVKPGNVLLGADGVVRITDFGIAWSATSAPLTRTGQVVGTACYLSPEQAEGQHATPASDVYALGMVAYECLAGHRAFDGDNPVQIALRQIREVPAPLPADVPENVRRLVDRALAKDPAERYPDGAAVRAAVADVRAGRRLDPVPTPRTRELSLPVAARRGRRLLVPVATLLVGAGLGVGALQLAAGSSGVVPPAAAAEDAVGDGAAATPEVEVLAGDLLGRPADEVEAELVRRGLQVARVEQVTTRTPPGVVVAVSPSGRLAPGTVVTLTVSVTPAAPPPGTPSAPGPSSGTSGTGALAALPSAPAQQAAPAPQPAGSGGGGSGSAGGSGGSAGPGTSGGAGSGNGAANGHGAANGNGGGNGNGNAGNGNGNGGGRG